jgi:hypothetical protein
MESVFSLNGEFVTRKAETEMKRIFRFSKIILLVAVVVSCAKQQADPGAGQPNQPGNIPSQCLPDQFGNVGVGCPVPSTANVNLEGDLVSTTEYSTVSLLRDFPGALEKPWNPYGPYGYSSAFSPAYRCQSTTTATCERECKNFRSGAQIFVQIVNGNGVVRFKGGPYSAPGLCSKSLNGSLYVVQIPAWVYSDPSNQGFSIKSALNTYNNGSFSIEVAQGSLSSGTTYNGRVFYRGQLIGNVLLYRKI